MLILYLMWSKVLLALGCSWCGLCKLLLNSQNILSIVNGCRISICHFVAVHPYCESVNSRHPFSLDDYIFCCHFHSLGHIQGGLHWALCITQVSSVFEALYTTFHKLFTLALLSLSLSEDPYIHSTLWTGIVRPGEFISWYAGWILKWWKQLPERISLQLISKIY